jgi:uncharacterized LabA/DUF88 family protein
MKNPPLSLPVIIDGPNYINRLLELGIAPIHIARQLQIRGLMSFIDEQLSQIAGISGGCGSAELFCSRKRFGPESRKFTEDQQTLLLNRLRSEVGVYVDVIDIHGSSEKGVDTTIAGRLHDLAGEVPAAILVSADRDFIPVLQKLRHKLKVVLVSINQTPFDLQNEAYATITLGEEYRAAFEYRYPRFCIQELDVVKLAELYSEADDRCINQLRVDYDGGVYFYVRSADRSLDHVKFRFESCADYNGYVGPKAASDATRMENELNELRLAWKHDIRGYIECPVEAMISSSHE